MYLEVVEKAQEEPPAKKLKVDDESDTEEPTKESPKDLDDTDGAKASKSPEVFDDDEKETLLQGEPKLNLFKNFFKMAWIDRTLAAEIWMGKSYVFNCSKNSS